MSKIKSPLETDMTAGSSDLIPISQEFETEIDNDTSDTLVFTPSSTSPFFCNITQEVKLAEKHKLKYHFSDDTSEEDDFQDNFYNTHLNSSLDNALLGDTSEQNSTTPTSNSDVDPGLPRNDFLDFEKCTLCKTDKKDINYPYCFNCFKRKKNLNPRKSLLQKKSCKITKSYFKTQKSTPFMSRIQNDKTESTALQEKNTDESSNNESENVESLQSKDIVDGYSQSSTLSSCSEVSSSHLKNPDGCRVCFSKPESGLFVHAKSAHLYGCYSCAQEIWYQCGGCPICRSKVFKVIKLYV